MNIIAANIAILHMVEESHKNLQLDGRFSPHKNFIEALENWCEANSLDFRTWQLSTYRIFTLINTTKIQTKEAVRYVLQRDRALLGFS